LKDRKKILSLFLTFLKLGCFTFGGGMSIVAQMQRIYVEDQKIISDGELLDLTSVARSMPGLMVGNVAMLFGYRCAGFWGGAACVIGMVLPPLGVVSLVTMFYSAFRDNQWIDAAMTGVRAGVVPIIVSAAVKMTKGAFRFPPCVLVTVLMLVLYLVFQVNTIYLVVLGALCGLVISEVYERKNREVAE